MWRVNPRITFRDCQHCLKFMYEEDTGDLMLNGLGQPFPRMPGNRAPCQIKGVGCDKGTYEHNVNHTEANRQAYQHYKECKATGDWPRDSDGEIDPIVKRNAAILDEAEAAWQREEWNKFRISALQILTGAISM